MSALPRLYGDNRGRQAAAIVLLVLCQALAMAAAAVATRQIFGSLHGSVPAPLHAAFITLGLSTIGFALARILAVRQAEKLGQSYAIDFRHNFYTHLSLLPRSTLAEKRVGALSIRFVGDLAALRDWASKGLTGMISALIIVPAACGVLWMLEPRYGVIGLCAIMLSLPLMVCFGLGLPATQAALRRQRGKLSIDMMERVAIAPILRLAGRSNADLKLLRQRGDHLSSAATRRVRQVETLRAIPEMVLGIAGVGLLWLTVAADIEAGTAAAGLAVISILTVPLRDLASVWDMRCAWIIARQKSQAIFDRPALARRSATRRLPRGPLPIRLDSVTAPGLGTICRRFPAGSRSAIAGPDGSIGVLFDLIAGVEDPSSGDVYIGDLPLPSISARDFSRRVKLVSLNTPILQGSVRRALTFGCGKRPDDDAVLRAAEVYRLSATIERLGGLDGRIYEHGRNLSLNEAVRLLLARTSLARASIVLIDLPLATLDSQTLALCRQFIVDGDATVLVAGADADIIDCPMDSFIRLAERIIADNQSNDSSRSDRKAA